MKKLGEFDRLVVFRLGKMIGVKGPGRVIVFPWMDKTKQIDVRATAFAVPPQQFITWDGGIVEMGADIQYCINDVITMASEVADHQVKITDKIDKPKNLIDVCSHNTQTNSKTCISGHSSISWKNNFSQNLSQKNC